MNKDMPKSNSKYYATLFNSPFNSLEDAKWNVKMSFTRKEAKKLIPHGEYIAHFIGDKLVSETPIDVDENGNISFGRTRKVTQ